MAQISGCTFVAIACGGLRTDMKIHVGFNSLLSLLTAYAILRKCALFVAQTLKIALLGEKGSSTQTMQQVVPSYGLLVPVWHSSF